MQKKLFWLVLVFILSSLVIYLRINFWGLYQRFGFYQGDIWYFYTQYGPFFKNHFFYQIEYPTGYVIIQKLTYFITQILSLPDTYESFMLATALLLIPLITLTVYLVYRITSIIGFNQKRALILLTLSPSLYIYGSINYDIFAVASVVGAIYLLLKDKYLFSFLLLTIGAVIKIYPAFLIPIFALYIINKKSEYLKVFNYLLGSLILYLVINIPFFLYNPNFWLFPYTYQSINPERNDPTTVSYYLFNFTHLNFLQGYLIFLLIFVSWVICFLFFKKRLLNPKNLLLLCYLTLFSAVLGNHVYVPQYILWFLPMVAILQIPGFFGWWLFDLMNAATRFFYFKLKGEWTTYLNIAWDTTVIYYLIMYIILLIHVKKAFTKDRSHH